MIRFAPQAAKPTSTPPRRATEIPVVPSLEQAGADGVPASPLLIPDLEEPVAASGRKVKSRSAKKVKAEPAEVAVQLDLAT